jgi:Bacterial extracellular solute-binding proteins, family 5 Middle
VVNRIEWITIADPATAAAALQNGEVDWLELVLPDLVPILRKNRNLTTAINDPLGVVGVLAMNHLLPPFNDLRARRALLMALNQEDYMRAVLGDEDSLWKPMPGYFAPGVPLYNEEGGEILKGPRRLDVAKRLLAESGYSGEPITLMAAQDIPNHKVWGDLTVDLLQRLGAKVDYAAVDGARSLRGGARNCHRARADGICSSPPFMVSTVPTRPIGFFVRMAISQMAGRTVRKSKPRSPPGLTQRTPTRNAQSLAGSTRPRSTTSSARHSVHSSDTTLGAKTSTASGQHHSPCSGASAKVHDLRWTYQIRRRDHPADPRTTD